MHWAPLIIIPPLMGALITIFARYILGDSNTTFIAILAVCAVVGCMLGEMIGIRVGG